MSAALGRVVEVGTVHFRLLPRPGFDLENLVVYDDPAFGAEPMLRASEVTADLRFSSLLRGRMEISRLDLSEPSLNLVHADNGRWNIESLLERSAQNALAPTAKLKSEPRPGFPYIEASSARINFKIGQEKKPYVLTNTDFNLWQESENSWGLRLKGQPFRTDINLSDTGTLRVNGTWQRAANLHETPLRFTFEWDRPQLGQLTKLLTGNDKGWRGAVLIDASISGTPSQLEISTDTSIRDFRRYDINASSLRLAAHCDSEYSSLDHALHQLFCRAPAGDGTLTLHGDLALFGQHKYDLVLMAQDVPASSILNVAKHVKSNISPNLNAAGYLEGSLSISAVPGQAAKLLGTGNIAQLHLIAGKDDLNLDSIPFVLNSNELADSGTSWKISSSGRRPAPYEPRLEFGPFPIPTGRTGAPTANGWLGRTGYNLSLNGEADIAKTLAFARILGVPVITAAVDGPAQINLQFAGNWYVPSPEIPSGPVQPQVTGNIKLHNVRAELRGVDGPVEILSSNIDLLPTEVRVTKLVATAAHSEWAGSLNLSRGCGTPGACIVHFNLSSTDANLLHLTEWANPKPKSRPWYKLLSPSTSAKGSFLSSVRASGRITLGHLQLYQFNFTHISAALDLDAGKLHISHALGDLLGGKYAGDFQAEFAAAPAVYHTSGTVTQVSLTRVAGVMKDPWIEGTATASYKLSGKGQDASEFWQSAEGSIDFEMNAGSLPRLLLVGEAPLVVNRLAGTALLQQGKLQFEKTVLASPAGTFLLSGSATLGQQLDLKLSRSPMAHTALSGTPGYSITGPLSQPRVTSLTAVETEAHLNGAK